MANFFGNSFEKSYLKKNFFLTSTKKVKKFIHSEHFQRMWHFLQKYHSPFIVHTDSVHWIVNPPPLPRHATLKNIAPVFFAKSPPLNLQTVQGPRKSANCLRPPIPFLENPL